MVRMVEPIIVGDRGLDPCNIQVTIAYRRGPIVTNLCLNRRFSAGTNSREYGGL